MICKYKTALSATEGEQMGLAAIVLKNPAATEGDVRDGGSIPWSGRSPGEGNDNPL